MFGNPDFSEPDMASSQSTQDMGSVPSLEQIFEMFAELKSQNLATQQSVADLTKRVSTTQQIVVNLNEQSKQDRALWMANHDKLTSLSEDYGQLTGEFIKTKGLVEASLQQILTDLDQNSEVVKKNVESLCHTCASVDEQTRRLDGHDTKLQDQQNASFFGNKNSLDKLDEFKEKQDRLNLRPLEVEDWVRVQAPKNLTLELAGASANEGTSKYIPPNERPRGNPKVGAQKTPQLTLGAGSSKNPPLHGSSDLNNATPKDIYLMPIADLLIDAATGHEVLSFMDGTAGYH
ncbi:hypothetical protein ACLB2K_031891 [Fragaria x ananassa]